MAGRRCASGHLAVPVIVPVKACDMRSLTPDVLVIDDVLDAQACAQIQDAMDRGTPEAAEILARDV